MMRTKRAPALALTVTGVVFALACGSDDSNTDPDETTSSAGRGGGATGGAGGSMDEEMGSSGAAGVTGEGGAAGGGAAGAPSDVSLCEKYGGPAAVGTVMTDHVLVEIASDCRVNAFFAALSDDTLTHIADCLAIQGQELFGCDGVTYAGSTSSVGLECRDMKTTHAGLGISQTDFDAVIEDIVAGLTGAGVEEDDIMAAAPALLGMSADIVESPDDGLTQDGCESP